MTWNRGSQGVSPKKITKRPHKTAKRRAAKQAMLLAKKTKSKKK